MAQTVPARGLQRGERNYRLATVAVLAAGLAVFNGLYVTQAMLPALVDAFDEQPGFQAGYSGNAFMGEMGMDPTAEMIGLAVAAIVLLVTFGSAIAAGIPLIEIVTKPIVGAGER